MLCVLMKQCNTVCCSVLQGVLDVVAGCCSVLHYLLINSVLVGHKIRPHCSVKHGNTLWCSALQGCCGI